MKHVGHHLVHAQRLSNDSFESVSGDQMNRVHCMYDTHSSVAQHEDIYKVVGRHVPALSALCLPNRDDKVAAASVSHA